MLPSIGSQIVGHCLATEQQQPKSANLFKTLSMECFKASMIRYKKLVFGSVIFFLPSDPSYVNAVEFK